MNIEQFHAATSNVRRFFSFVDADFFQKQNNNPVWSEPTRVENRINFYVCRSFFLEISILNFNNFSRVPVTFTLVEWWIFLTTQ
jgi:hypothetical protein